MTHRSKRALLDAARKALAATPVDEDQLHVLLIQLIDKGMSKAELVRELRMTKQFLFRLLSSRQPDLIPYHAMCGGKASVIEVLHGMPTDLREALRQQFDHTGRPFSQAQLRRISKDYAAGDITLADLKPAPKQRSARQHNAATASGQAGFASRVEEEDFLRSLIEPVARGEQACLARMMAPGSLPVPADQSMAKKDILFQIGLTERQALRLIRRLGNKTDIAPEHLQNVLMRLIGP